MKQTTLPTDIPVKAGARIHEHALSNGMPVLIAERHLDPVVAVMIWYRVGARDEREREAGVSHFLEHMMFKGSRGFGKGEVDRLTTLLGGSNNAFTSPDHTAYWFELASDRWEKALEIEADRMQALLLDPAEFEAEKAVVLEELSMGLDDPWRRLTELVQQAVFPRHPYRRPVIGYKDTLAALTVDDMRAYWRDFYHPGNATLVICGDVDPARALALAEAHFGSISAGKPRALAAAWRPHPEPPVGEQRVNMRWEDAGSRLCIAWPTAAVASDDDFALDLASAILSSGRLSRLHRRLVLEQGLATSISTQNDTRAEQGCFWLFAECALGVQPRRLEEAIDRELAALRSELLPTAELTRAKRMIAAGEAHESETVSDLAEELGEFATDATWRVSLEQVDRIRAVDARKLRSVCERLLTNDRRVVGWCLPRMLSLAETHAEANGEENRKHRVRTKALGDRAAKRASAAKTLHSLGKRVKRAPVKVAARAKASAKAKSPAPSKAQARTHAAAKKRAQPVKRGGRA